MFEIRPFRFDDADYAAGVAIQNAADPLDPMTVDQWRLEDAKRKPELHYGDYAAEMDGKMVAVGFYGNSIGRFHPRKYQAYLYVDPPYQNRGIGTALADKLESELLALNPLEISTKLSESNPTAFPFAEKRGYVETLRQWLSLLDPRTVDAAQWQAYGEQATAQGIEIIPFGTLQAQPNSARRLHDLMWLLLQDVPTNTPFTYMPHEQWRERVLHNPKFLPDANFIAVDNGEWVGISILHKDGKPHKLITGLTGVRRDYRGKGLAFALKVRALAYAQAHDYHQIRTYNEVNNHAMLHINERLGFVRQPADVIMTKIVNQ